MTAQHPLAKKVTKTQLMDLLQDEFPGYDPVVSMAYIAHDERYPIDLRFAAHKEVARYVRPQLKAMEISGQLENPVEIQMVFGNKNADSIV